MAKPARDAAGRLGISWRRGRSLLPLQLDDGLAKAEGQHVRGLAAELQEGLGRVGHAKTRSFDPFEQPVVGARAVESEQVQRAQLYARCDTARVSVVTRVAQQQLARR